MSQSNFRKWLYQEDDDKKGGASDGFKKWLYQQDHEETNREKIEKQERQRQLKESQRRQEAAQTYSQLFKPLDIEKIGTISPAKALTNPNDVTVEMAEEYARNQEARTERWEALKAGVKTVGKYILTPATAGMTDSPEFKEYQEEQDREHRESLEKRQRDAAGAVLAPYRDLVRYDELEKLPDYASMVAAGERAQAERKEEERIRSPLDFIEKLAKSAVLGPFEEGKTSAPADLVTELTRKDGQITGRQESLLNDTEKDRYYYLLAKAGQEAADTYLNSLKDQLALRGAMEDYEAVQKFPGPIRGIEKGAISFSGGVQGAVTGFKNLPALVTGGETDYSNTELEYLQSLINSESSGIPNVLYQSSYAIGNMAPSIALGMATGGAGASSALGRWLASGGIQSTAFSAQTAGQTYRQDLMEGRPVSGAQLNAMLTAADEAATNWLLNGVSQFGGGVLKKALGNTKVASAARQGISHALAKNPGARSAALALADWGSDAASEASQEALQNITESMRKALVYGDEFNLVDELTNPETWEAALIGGVTAGIMNAPGAIGRWRAGVDTAEAMPPSNTETGREAAKEYAEEHLGAAQAAEEPGLQTASARQRRAQDMEAGKIPQTGTEAASGPQDDSQAESAVKAWGSVFESNGQKAFEKNYDGQTDIGTYYKAFSQAYNVGRYETELTQAQRAQALTFLSSEAYQAAQKAGYQDANMAMEARKAANTVSEGIAGLGMAAENATAAQKTIASHVGKLTGLTIDLVDSLENHQGAAASYEHGRITIDINADDFNGAISHELTHYIQDQAPEGYRVFQKYAVQAMTEAKSMDLEAMLEATIGQYEQAGQTINRAQAMDELTADATQKFLNDPKFIESVIKEDRTLGQKILDFLTDIVDALKELARTGSTRASAKAIEEKTEYYERLRDNWYALLEEASDNYKKKREKGKAEAKESTAARYQLKQGNKDSQGRELSPEQQEYKDIRFQLKEPVEETKDLIAVHNLDSGKLLKTLSYEGIPMPSIAVTKAELGHENFGDISLLFRKETIDPAKRKNKVYGADAWTPTFPKIEYEVDDERINKIKRKLGEWAQGKIPDYYLNTAQSFVRSIENEIDRWGGEDGVVRRALDRTDMQAVYLASQGHTIKHREKEERIELSPERKGLAEAIAKELGDELETKGLNRKLVNQFYGERIRKAWIEYLVAQGETQAIAEETVKNGPSFKITDKFLDAREYRRNGGITIRTVRDAQAMEDEIHSKLNQTDYQKWLEDLFRGIVSDSGISNNKDRFYADGRSRSFKQTHMPVNAENIVKSMLSQADDVRNVTGFNGIKSIRAVATEDFKSIKRIKEASGKLQKLDGEQYQKIQEELDKRLVDTMSDIIGASQRNSALSMEWLGNGILEACANPTPDHMKSTLEKYEWKVTQAQAKELAQIVKEVQEMPVDMFEAKPQRVVGFDEIAAAVVPEQETAAIDALQDKGVEVLTYDPEQPGSRRETVNSVADIRFQLEEVEDEGQLIRNLKKENKHLQAANESLKKQLTLTKGDELRQGDIKKVAGKLLKDYSSSYKRETLEHNLTKLYDYIRSADQVDSSVVKELAAGIAKNVLNLSQQMDEQSVQYRELKQYLRKTKVKIENQDKADLAAAGGYNEFRKKYFGSLYLGNDGISIDSFYQELSAQHPELFPASYTHPADQLMAVANAVDQIRERVRNPYHANIDEMAEIVGSEIIKSYMQIRNAPPTFADRQAALLEGARVTYLQNINKKSAEMAKFQADYAKQMEKYKEEIKERYEKGAREAKKALIDERERLTVVRNDLLDRIDSGELRGEELKDARREERELKERLLDLARQQNQIRYITRPDQYVENMRKIREKKQRGRDKAAILRDIKAMQNWLLKPNTQKHVPDELKGATLEFLHSIDYSTDYLNRRGEKTARTEGWDDLQAFWNAVKDGEEWNGKFYDGDPDIADRLTDLKKKVKDIGRLDDLSPKDMSNLRRIVSAMKKTVMEVNELKANQRATDAEALSEAAVSDLRGLKNRNEYGDPIIGGADKLLNYDSLTPYTVFWMMGKNMLSLYQSFRKAADEKTTRLKEAEDFTKETVKDLGLTPKEVKEWTGKNAKARTFQVSGGQISLTPAMIMSLYVTNKREQGRKHIYGDGIKNAPILSRQQKNAQKEEVQEKERKKELGGWLPSKILKEYQPVRVTPADVEKITSTLTQKQRDFADRMQKFLMLNAAEWGNEASLLMYGYKKFMSREYWPILTDQNYVFSTEGNLKNLFLTVRNFGMTKQVDPNANNAVIIDDIFDVFSRHVDQMSTYSAFLAPLSDFNKVYNYKDKKNLISVKQEIERSIGTGGKDYLERLIRDINGGERRDRTFLDGMLSNAKGAAVAASLSVAIQQPSAYLRALSEIDAKYLGKGIFTLPTKKLWKQICKYSPIAQWKDWGFYQMNTSRALKDILFETDSLKGRINNVAMMGAQKADQMTWSWLWRACENEIRDKRKALEPGTEAFYQAVGQRFSEIIDKTQVVDSVLHRTQIMRSKDFGVKAATAFMGEPLSTYNMLYRAGVDLQRGNPGAKGRAARTAAAFIASGAFGAALKSFISALRDDDEDKAYWEKYWAAFGGLDGNFADNINPLGMIPLGKDFLSIVQGYEPSRMELQSYEDLWSTALRVGKLTTGESKETSAKVLADAAGTVGNLFGLPVKNIIRDADALYTTAIQASVGLRDDYLRTKSRYDIGNEDNRSRFAKYIVEAEAAGNQELSEEIYNDLIESGQETEKIESSVNSIITKNYKEDALVQAAAEAKADNDLKEYGEAFEALVEVGYNPKSLKSAIGSLEREIYEERGEEDPRDVLEEDAEEEDEEPEEQVSAYESKDLIWSIEQLRKDETGAKEQYNAIVDEMYQTKIANGMEPEEARKSLRTTITNTYKPRWQAAGEAEKDEILILVKNLQVDGRYIYSGYDFNNWKKKEE